MPIDGFFNTHFYFLSSNKFVYYSLSTLNCVSLPPSSLYLSYPIFYIYLIPYQYVIIYSHLTMVLITYYYLHVIKLMF